MFILLCAHCVVMYCVSFYVVIGNKLYLILSYLILSNTNSYNNHTSDNHFHASISTDTKYYSDEQFVRDVKSKGDLSFIHFNARSLNKNFQKIKDSIDDLKFSFDIIAISETWAETDTIDGFTLNGYEAFHIVRGQRKGGGVALYVHRRFNCAIRAVQCKVVEKLFECVTVELHLKKHKNITELCLQNTWVGCRPVL